MISILNEPHAAIAGTNLGAFGTVLPPTGAREDKGDLLDRRIGLRRGLLRRDLHPIQPHVECAGGKSNVLSGFDVGPANDHAATLCDGL